MTTKYFRKVKTKREYKCMKCKKFFRGICYSYETLGFVTGSNPLKFCEKCYFNNKQDELKDFISKLY